MNIVITMAGVGSRFKEAGYEQPKYMIEVKGRTLFEWSAESIASFCNEPYIFIVRKADNAKNFIETKCRKCGIKNYNIIEINKFTKGQAETAMLAETYWKADEPLFIYNIDTYVERDVLSQKKFKGDGFIPCFNSQGEHWSFVRLNECGMAVEVREKKRISSNCSIGAYYFRSCTLYSELYRELYEKKGFLENGERYIAPMYNLLIERGGVVYIQDIPQFKVHVLGTPKEVEEFANLGLNVYGENVK